MSHSLPLLFQSVSSGRHFSIADCPDGPTQPAASLPDSGRRGSGGRCPAPFSYEELLARDKLSLDLAWLRDESLEDTENLPPPDVIAQEIAEDLEAALSEFAQIAESLRAKSP